MPKKVPEIPWSTIAPGTGRVIVEALVARASADPVEAADAHGRLIATLAAASAASAAAVPLLVALAVDPAVHDRPSLLALLLRIALGDPARYLVPGGTAREEAVTADPESPAIDAWSAVLDAIPRLAKGLADPRPDVRAATAYLFGFFPSAREGLPALRKAVPREKDGAALASIVLALGLLQRGRHGAPDGRAIEALHDDAREPVRTAAAIARAHLWLDATSAEGIDALERAATTRPFTDVPWNDGDLGALAASLRASLHVEPPAELAARLSASAARGQRGADELALADALLDRVFARRDERIVPAELNEAQRAVLRAIVDVGRCGQATRARGLPFDAAANLRLLGVGAPGPLDAKVVLEGRELPGWKVLHDAALGGVPLEAAMRALEPVAPRDRLAMVEDALAGGYELWRGSPSWDVLPADRAAEQVELNRAHHERLVEVLAALIATTAGDGDAWARDEPWRTSNVAAGLDVAWRVARAARGSDPPPDLEARVRRLLELPPAHRRPRVVRAALALLPAERAQAIAREAPLMRPQGTTLVVGPGWDVVQLLPIGERVAAIVQAIEACAGHAVPDPKRAPRPPLARARTLLLEVGRAAIPALEASAARGHREAPFLGEVLAVIGAATPRD